MAKINENYSNFFKKATAAGFGTNEIVSFMENLFQNPAGQAEKSRLQQGQAQGSLRPDELAGSQAIHSSEQPGRFLKGAANVATKIGAAGYGATQLPELLKKGLGALGAMGLGNQAKTEKPLSEETSESIGGFEEFMKQNPELGSFLQKAIEAGQSPEDAAMRAKGVKKFRDAIANIEDSVGQPFESLLSQLFQGASQSQPKQQKQSSPAMSQFMQALQQFQQLTGK